MSSARQMQTCVLMPKTYEDTVSELKPEQLELLDHYAKVIERANNLNNPLLEERLNDYVYPKIQEMLGYVPGELAYNPVSEKTYEDKVRELKKDLVNKRHGVVLDHYTRVIERANNLQNPLLEDYLNNNVYPKIHEMFGEIPEQYWSNDMTSYINDFRAVGELDAWFITDTAAKTLEQRVIHFENLKPKKEFVRQYTEMSEAARGIKNHNLEMRSIRLMDSAF